MNNITFRGELSQKPSPQFFRRTLFFLIEDLAKDIVENSNSELDLAKLRTREGPIRTMSLLEVTVKIPVEQTITVYQKLAPKIKQMKALGMSYREIAAGLGIDKKTVGKAVNFVCHT